MNKIFKSIKRKINSILYYFDFLKIINSPFKFPKVKFYFGDIVVGHPYFLPRRWKKDKSGVMTCHELKFGFDWCTLGWKTKWGDYRFEWSPSISFVAFKKQFAIIVYGVDKVYEDSYWEAWLYYKNNTKGTKSERIKETINKFNCVWKHYSEGKEITVNHYNFILKNNYKKYIK